MELGWRSLCVHSNQRRELLERQQLTLLLCRTVLIKGMHYRVMMQNRVAETTREPTTCDVDWGDGNILLIRPGVLGKVVQAVHHLGSAFDLE